MDDLDDDVLDAELVRALGPAATALREWGALKRIRYSHHRWFTNGRSTALVGIVYEEDRDEGTTKVILKMDRLAGDRLEAAEYGRQRDAVRESPEFARKHLARLAEPGHDLVRVGEGWWIVFQSIAGGSVEDLDVLTKWLASVRSGGPVGTDTNPRRSVSCDGDTFAGICGGIVHSVLAEWQDGKPATTRMSVPEFLGTHLADRHHRPGRLHDAVATMTAPTIRFRGRPEAFVNPFALLHDNDTDEPFIVRALVGRAHGDLHTENVLIPARTAYDRSAFRLIDLAKYDRRAPLTRDPAHLLVYIIARTLEDLNGPQTDALISVLVEPDSVQTSVLPPWLPALVMAVRDAGEGWAYGAGLITEWRTQFQLSLIGCALILFDRPSTRDEDRLWFLRLAAHATAAFCGGEVVRPSNADHVVDESTVLTRGRPAPGPASGEWVSRMCEHLPFLKQRARKVGREDQIEALTRAALAGQDRTMPFIDLVDSLGDAADGMRAPMDPPRTDEVFTCPLAVACPRVELLQPGDAEPRCHLLPGVMRTEFW